jgi:hypothetical protein
MLIASPHDVVQQLEIKESSKRSRESGAMRGKVTQIC